MDALRKSLTAQVAVVLKGAPARCEKLLQARATLEADRPGAISQDVPATLSSAFDFLDAEVHGAARDMRDIAAYIRLHMPVHEDGNNFYVDMQDGVAKICEDAAGKIAELTDMRVQYLEKRADIKEKVAPPASSDTSETKSSSEGVDNDGKETKNKKNEDTSTQTVKTTKVVEVPQERKEAVLRLDQAWHGKVVRALSQVAYELAKTVDMASKNQAKVLDPRGEGSGTKQGGMYY